MLGELIYEEKGTTSGVRVVSAEHGEVTVEVTLQTQGTIKGVDHACLWTYWSKTRADGSIYGEGKGVMNTSDGAVITLIGNGAAEKRADGSVSYRGCVFFHTGSEKYSYLNTIAGVHEYDVDAQGSTAAKIWEWK